MVHMSKSTSCIRWTAFVLDALIAIGGSVMLGFSIWVYTQDNEYKHIMNNTTAAACFIALSVLVFVIGFIGTCAILLLKPGMLKFYFAMITILFIVELAGSIYLYLQKDQMQGFVETNWNNTDDGTRILIQQKLKCCSMQQVITSHASSSDDSCYETVKVRRKDCFTELISWFKRNVIILATCAVGLAALQMFLLASSCRLLATIESGDRMVKQVKVRPLNDPTKSQTTRHTTMSQPSIHDEDGFPIEESSLHTKMERRDWAKVGDNYKKRKQLESRAAKKRT